MTTAADVDKLIRCRLNPRAEIFLAPAIPFDLKVPDLGIDLRGWQTSVYHPVFDPVVIESKHHGLVVAPNTYLSSFTYNLIAAWDYYFDGTDRWKSDRTHRLAKALRLNFKKFFAEQILRRTHNLFGIAIFLETLLYEEEIMYPVLAATPGNHRAPQPSPPPSADELRSIANWMTGLVLNHELGHVFHRRVPNFREKLLAELPQPARQLPRIWDSYQGSTEEFECDALAVGMSLAPSASSLTATEKYRLTILGFAVFAALHALDLCADATAKASPADSEDPDRLNVRQSMKGGSYVIGTYPALQKDRARAVRLLVEAIAEAESTNIYGHKDRFRISPTIVEDLEGFMSGIVEGTDIRIRGKCEMLARALHGHREGIDYLVWRSKTYTGPSKEGVPSE